MKRDARESASGGNGSRRPSVAIVGAGFGGLGAAALLRRQGRYDFTIFDRAPAVGGVWQANSYPGAACDVPSHLYSFSFAPGHPWSRRFAPREEIAAYLERLVDRFALGPRLRLATEVREARFDPASGRWAVTTGDGEVREFNAVIAACGQLTNPALPGIPGRADFGGPAFHSARWDHRVDVTGKRVAVIGTGASAIQFAPRVAAAADQMDIYQRSAPWVLPKFDRGYPAWERRLFRALPAFATVPRAAYFAVFNWLAQAFIGNRRVNGLVTRLSNAYRRRALAGHPELIAKTTPDYSFGCKRILLTSEWYKTLRRDNVALHCGGGLQITPTGVIGPDGRERAADVIIFGTGFCAGDFVLPMRVYGSGGEELAQTWDGRPEAYLGTVVSGYPNLFLLYGPNTNHGSGSVPFVHECQLHYVLDALERLDAGGFRSLDVKPETQARWRDEIAHRSQDTAWITGNCGSWYLNGERINTHNWPGEWKEYRRRTQALDESEYAFSA